MVDAIKEVMGEEPWEPISTAPLDGETVELTDGKTVWEGGWLDCPEVTMWTHHGEYGGGLFSEAPTHWRRIRPEQLPRPDDEGEQ